MTSNNCQFDLNNLALDFPENSSVLIKSVWSNTYFSIILFDGQNTWTGEMVAADISKLSEQLGLSSQQYIKECRNAFSARGKDTGFIYLLKDGTFQWKKESFDMRITFGQILIKKTPVVSTLHTIINEMLNENLLLKEKLGSTEKEKNSLVTDNKHLIETLEECNVLKSKIEDDLLKQFLKVLNTKKEKIKELKKHGHLKRQDESKENDTISKYECDTDVDSDSDGGGDEEDDDGSASDKERMNKMSDGESDSDGQSDKCLLLPKRNRSATSRSTLPKTQSETEKKTGPRSEKCEKVPEKQPKTQAVPSTSSYLSKKVHGRVPISFVDSDDEFGDISLFSTDRKPIPSPENNQNSSVMHSPKKHGRFRNQIIDNETSIPSTENGPSAKVPKIENKCVPDECDSSIRISENNHQIMNKSQDIPVKFNESSCSKTDSKETKVSVKDLIEGLFS